MLATQANERYQGLESKLVTISSYQSDLNSYETLYGTDPSKWPQGKRESYQQLESAIRSLKASYNLDCSDYRALWSNEWKSIVAPKDLPTTCNLID